MNPSGDHQQGILAKYINKIIPSSEGNAKYQVQQRIGKGVFGDVHKVLEIHTDGAFALKAAKGRGIIFLKREYDLLLRLNGDSGFTRAYDYIKLGSDQDCIEAMVLDLVNGMDLKKRKLSDGPLGTEQTANIAVTMLHCLEKLHALGWLHTDIKPANILMNDNTQINDMSRYYLIDLGSALRYRKENGDHVDFF